MSLFRTREWWCNQQDVEEECGLGCLCVANIDNAKDKNDKVISGSYQGNIHIYAPTSNSNQAHDVLLEANLQLPILQLASGKFVSVSSDLHLAVLHPRLLAVYKISVSEGAVEHGHQYKLEKMYQHKLERTAASMVAGPFGKVQNRDLICVQSMDGVLSIFEHETLAFARFLPGFLLPGPLAYNYHSDSFLTVSSSLCVESYSYQVLAVATDSNNKEEKQPMSGGKRITVDWSLNIGEFARDIVVLEQNGKSVIMVLGERSLFCIEESGDLRFMKKFECNVSCFHTSLASNERSVQSIVCTHSQQLLVYEDLKLSWAAKLDVAPINVGIGVFSDVSGMLVTMTETCKVSCCYLGTAPVMFSLPRSKQREVDLNTLDTKMRQLNGKIAEMHSTKGSEIIGPRDTEDMSMNVEVPKILDKISVASQNSGQFSAAVPSITTQVLLKATRRVTNLQMSVESSKPLKSNLEQFSISSLTDGEPPPSIRPSFFLEEPYPPASLYQDITVHYQQASGAPRIASTTIRVPLTLVARPAAPVKKMEHRVTLECNKPCINLMELFSDFVCESSGPHCIGFEYYNGVVATILTSKTSNRYRVQCDSYDGLWLITSDLVQRVHQLQSDVRISVQDQPSLNELAEIIDQHFQLRVAREEIRHVLEQRAHQYRVIQRRLLARFKDKTPAPLNCLDTLLEGTHIQLLAVADAMIENENSLRTCSTSLSCACRLLILLTKLWRGLPEAEERSFSSLLCVEQTFSKNSAGWEEMVDAGLTSVLRSSMSKSGSRDHVVPTSQQSLDLPVDTVKLKKHLAILMDRLAKGTRLPAAYVPTIKPPASRGEVPSSKPNKSQSQAINSFYDQTPITKPKKSPEKPPRVYTDVTNLESMLPSDGDVRLPPSMPPVMAALPEDLYNDYSTIPNGNLEEDYIHDQTEFETPRRLSVPLNDENDIESPSFYDDSDIFS